MAGPWARWTDRWPFPRSRASETATGEPRDRDIDGGAEDRRAELARAARLLEVRTRREATGLFAGAYASAFRGGGMEFHESHPYVPGDDVRSLDWNAMARTGEPFVKRFREERDQTLLLALDTSASMAFGALGEPVHRVAAHAAALLAAAAGNAGDRVGLATFDDRVRDVLPPGRGAQHTWNVIRAAARRSARPERATLVAAGLDALIALADTRSVCVVLSDFREAGGWGRRSNGAAASLAALAGRHEAISIVVYDPREVSLPRVGLLRVGDPERPGRTRVIDTRRKAVRARHRRAWAARSRELERALRSAGSDVVWMRTDRDPLKILMHYFHRRAARARRAS